MRHGIGFAAALWCHLVFTGVDGFCGTQWLKELTVHIPQPWPASLEVKRTSSLVTRLSRLSLVVMVVGFGVQGSLRDWGCLIVPVLAVGFGELI